MTEFEKEVKELEEKIDFCSLFIKYAKLLEGTDEQSARAFKRRLEYEEELNVLKLRGGK